MTRSARDIYHDLSNALGGLLVGAELGERRAQGDAERANYATLTAGARRAADLVAALRPAVAAASERSASESTRDNAYIDALNPELPPLLARTKAECERDAIPLLDLPSARLLALLVAAVSPKTILELGTAHGYSALWMALAQDKVGKIITVDPDGVRAAAAKSLFREAGVADRIEVIERPALEVLSSLGGHVFDLVFIDAVKTEYARYLDAALPLLRPGGLVVVDNLLWHNRSSAPPSPDDDESTIALRQFNATFLSHPSLRAVIVPVGDGIGLGVKTG